jgi:hypothetical protein
VFLFAFSPFLTGFRQKSLFLGHNEENRILPFFQKCEILFSSVFLLFSSRCAFFKRDQKRGEKSQEKILFCSLTHFTRKRKGRKNSSHYEGRSAFSESALKVFFFSRGRFVLSSKELFSFSIIVLLYSKQ